MTGTGSIRMRATITAPSRDPPPRGPLLALLPASPLLPLLPSAPMASSPLRKSVMMGTRGTLMDALRCVSWSLDSVEIRYCRRDSGRCVNQDSMIRVCPMHVPETVSISLPSVGTETWMPESSVIWDRGTVTFRMRYAERTVLFPGAGMGYWIRGSSVMTRIFSPGMDVIASVVWSSLRLPLHR